MSTLLNNRYRIIKTLGKGGFGQTYMAQDTHRFDEPCVIKQLRPLVDDPQTYELIKERFEREAAVLYSLSSSSNKRIPKLHAYFNEGNEFYLAQDFIEGENLGEKVDLRGPMPGGDVEKIVGEVLSALDEVHSSGIIHRDIKPENIMMRGTDSRLFLIDFGAVKEIVAARLDSRGALASSLIIGSPGFMPFEQVNGQPVFASDLYSLGLTAVYLMTGKRPDELRNANGGFDWRPHAHDLPASLEATINRSLQVFPGERFQTAREMFDSLKEEARKNSYTRRVERASKPEGAGAAEAAPRQSQKAASEPSAKAASSAGASPAPTRAARARPFIVGVLGFLLLGGASAAVVFHKKDAEHRIALAETRLADEAKARRQAEEAARRASGVAAGEAQKRAQLEQQLGEAKAKQPSVTINGIESEPISDGRGVWIRVSYSAHNLRDVNCKLTALLYDTEGNEMGMVSISPAYFTPGTDNDENLTHSIFLSESNFSSAGWPDMSKVEIRISKRSADPEGDYLDTAEHEFTWP
jgi:tRNA A-37 threonylcarbamoyl transferase component Bud32